MLQLPSNVSQRLPAHNRGGERALFLSHFFTNVEKDFKAGNLSAGKGGKDGWLHRKPLDQRQLQVKCNHVFVLVVTVVSFFHSCLTSKIDVSGIAFDKCCGRGPCYCLADIQQSHYGMPEPGQVCLNWEQAVKQTQASSIEVN